MKNKNPQLEKEFYLYRKNGGIEPFGQWCAFVRRLPEEQMRAALILCKVKNYKERLENKDTVWTPDGRVKMNPEYIENAIRLRAFQKAQREADPEWMAHDKLTKALGSPQIIDQIKTAKNPAYYCTGCQPRCVGHRKAEYVDPPEMEEYKKYQNANFIIKWVRKKKKKYDYRRDLKTFRDGK